MIERIRALPFRFLLAAIALLAGPAASIARANVLDVGAGTAYPTIQAAVDAAQDGDVLLVHSGGYAGFLVVDKSLTIVAETGALVAVVGGTQVRDLAAARTVVLIGLQMQGTSTLTGSALDLSADAGHVRVEDCLLVGGSGGLARAVSVTGCADVYLSGCSMQGGLTQTQDYAWCGRSGGVGLDVRNSQLTAYRCSIRGGNGTDGHCNCGLADGGPGAHAAFVWQSTVFVSTSTFQGGDGGDAPLGSIWNAPVGGDAGNGITAYTATVRILDSTASAGIPGGYSPALGTCGGDAGGYSGQLGVGLYGGSYTPIAGFGRGLSVSPLAHAGTLDSITVRGQPGDVVGLFLAPTTQASYVPAWHGTLLVPLRTAPSATHAVLVGTIPASGVLDFPLAIPALAPGAASQTRFLQALFHDVQGERWLSGAHCMTTLP